MASDGPKQPGAPRVPPPPTLSFAAKRPAPAVEDDVSDEDQTIAVHEVDAAFVELVEEIENAEDPAPDPDEAVTLARPSAPPPPRRGVLPPPSSDGKRISPLSSKGTRGSAAKRPSASGLPSGVRPPGAPEATEAENTDVLIASAVAALTEGSPAEDAPPPEDDAAAALPVPSLDEDAAPAPAAEQPAPSAAPIPVETAPSEPRRRPLWVPIAAGAGVLALVLLFALRSSDGETTVAAAPQAPRAAVAVDQAPQPSPQAAEQPAVVVDAPRLDVGARLDLGSEEPDVGSLFEEKLDLPPELDEDVVAEDVEEPAPTTDKATSRRKRGRNKGNRPAATASAPPPPPPKAEADPAALLADARKALAAGNARRAYSLAVKSRRAKSSAAALVVMAKAACRFGGEAQAKSAFGQLKVSDRRGIRAECRKHGVRLGL